MYFSYGYNEYSTVLWNGSTSKLTFFPSNLYLFQNNSKSASFFFFFLLFRLRLNIENKRIQNKIQKGWEREGNCDLGGW